MAAVEPIFTARARLGEGPLWDPVALRLYWVDIYNHRVHWFAPDTGAANCWDVGDTVGAIALTAQGRILMALRHGLGFLDPNTGQVVMAEIFEDGEADKRLNDGKCDAAGRFWIGSMCTAGPGASLYRYDPDGTLHTMETGLTVSNGLGWSPDNQRFYLADSPLQKVFVYDFDLETGAIANRQVHIDLTHQSAFPDGLTVDTEGCIWVALWDGWGIKRFDPDGKLMDDIEVPVQRPTSCTFGGPELKRLYITSASVGLSEAEIQKSFLSGDVFALDTDVCGLPAHTFDDDL